MQLLVMMLLMHQHARPTPQGLTTDPGIRHVNVSHLLLENVASTQAQPGREAALAIGAAGLCFITQRPRFPIGYSSEYARQRRWTNTGPNNFFLNESDHTVEPRQQHRTKQTIRMESSSPQAQFEQGRTFLNLAGQASWPRAVEHFWAAADSGHAVATAWLAHCHWYGQGVAKNLTVAQQLAHQIMAVLLADADHGDASAQAALGSMYRDGLGCVRDQHGAVAWFRKAAEQGDLEAQICLSVAYRDGHGVEQDDREAAVWLRKAAEQEDIEAQYSLGEAYLAGEGVAREWVGGEWPRGRVLR